MPQVQTHTFESISLLLHRLPHHLPEAVGHCQAQVLSGHLMGLQHTVTAEREEAHRLSTQHFKMYVWQTSHSQHGEDWSRINQQLVIHALIQSD